METTVPAATATTSSSVSHGAGGGGARVLLLPVPGAQGHTNPMLQLGRRLAYHGLRPTLVATRYVLSTTPPPGSPFGVAAISDGCDAGGMASCPDMAEYVSRLAAVGSETLRELLLSEAAAAVRVLVYASPLPWAGRVARGGEGGVDGIDAAGGGEAVDQSAVRRGRQSDGFAWHSPISNSRARTATADTALLSF